MRYFFHVEGNDQIYEDKSGGQFGSVEEALVEARTISEQLTPEAEYHGCHINVVDGRGNLVDAVPIPLRLH